MAGDRSEMTVEEVLAEVDAAWAEIADLVDGTTAEALAHPGPDGRAAKDILIHLAAWEGALLALLDGSSRARALGVDPDSCAAMSEDDVNAVIFRRHRDRPPGEIVAEVRETHASLRERLGGLSDDDLRRPPPSSGAGAKPLVDEIASYTVEHYREHRPEIGQRLVSG